MEPRYKANGPPKSNVKRSRRLKGSLQPVPQPGQPLKRPAAEPAPAPVHGDHKLLPDRPVPRVRARIDVGFGNALFIRGQGQGLSWDKGQPLHCVDASTWVWSTPHSHDKVTFKLLLNDQIWAQGQDIVLEPARTVEIVPRF